MIFLIFVLAIRSGIAFSYFLSYYFINYSNTIPLTVSDFNDTMIIVNDYVHGDYSENDE